MHKPAILVSFNVSNIEGKKLEQNKLVQCVSKTEQFTISYLWQGIEPAEASFFDPYQHFVPGLNNATDPNSQRYKICEKEPPAMEKVSSFWAFLGLFYLLITYFISQM